MDALDALLERIAKLELKVVQQVRSLEARLGAAEARIPAPKNKIKDMRKVRNGND